MVELHNYPPLYIAMTNYYSILDFIFTANLPANWDVDCRILSDRFTSTDDEQHSDHKPLEGRIFIN